MYKLFDFQGFVTAVTHMRPFVPAVYDVTLAIPKNSPPPTMLGLFSGQSSVVSQKCLNGLTVTVKSCLCGNVNNWTLIYIYICYYVCEEQTSVNMNDKYVISSYTIK